MVGYELLRLDYDKNGCVFTSVAAVRKPNGEIEEAAAESLHNCFESILRVVDKILGEELLKKFHFGKYDFHPINPRRRLAKKAEFKTIVYINHPFGDGFCGQYQDRDLGLALGMAYLDAINRLLAGRPGRDQAKEVVASQAN